MISADFAKEENGSLPPRQNYTKVLSTPEELKLADGFKLCYDGGEINCRREALYE